jgi:hypothetical protein
LNHNEGPTLPDALARSIARTHEISTVVSKFPISRDFPTSGFPISWDFFSPLTPDDESHHTNNHVVVDRSVEGRDSIHSDSSRAACDSSVMNLMIVTVGCMRDRSGPESSREVVGTSKKFKFSEVGRDATN